MTRIGRASAAAGVGGLAFNNGALYAGQNNGANLQMFLAGSGGADPTSVGTFPLGSGTGVCINRAFVMSPICDNYLFVVRNMGVQSSS